MNDRYVYGYLRQQAKLPMLKLHTLLEIETAIDRTKGVPEGVGMRREKEMLYQKCLCRAFGIKAKQFNTATIVWE